MDSPERLSEEELRVMLAVDWNQQRFTYAEREMFRKVLAEIRQARSPASDVVEKARAVVDGYRHHMRDDLDFNDFGYMVDTLAAALPPVEVEKRCGNCEHWTPDRDGCAGWPGRCGFGPLPASVITTSMIENNGSDCPCFSPRPGGAG